MDDYYGQFDEEAYWFDGSDYEEEEETDNLFDEVDDDHLYLEDFDDLCEEEVARDDIVEEVRNEFLNATSAGMAFAFAEEIASSKSKSKYDLNEDTDAENWLEASRYIKASSKNRRQKGKLRPFEQMVDDICKGRRSLFE